MVEEIITLGEQDKGEGMVTKRVLISSTDFILGAAVLQQLSAVRNLELIGIPDKELCKIYEAVKHLHPDILVLVDLLHCEDTHEIQDLLSKYKGLKIITLSSGDDQLHIYHERSLLLMKLGELPKVITA